MMDPISGKRICYVQFPQRFDGIDRNVDTQIAMLYSSMQINMKGLDGIQGPIYVGTGCVFRGQDLYGLSRRKHQEGLAIVCQNGVAAALVLKIRLNQRRSMIKRN